MRGANCARAPELRDAALAGTLNRPPCPACGVAHDTDATVVYTDPPRGHWISVARCAELARWSEVEEVALGAFRAGLGTAPELAPPLVRIVFDLDELRERLAIWDAGLDDGVVECVKLACLREQPAIRGAHERIRFVRATPEGLVMRIVEAAAPLRGRADFDVPREAVARVAAEPVWRERFPRLFEPGFVAIDRYLR